MIAALLLAVLVAQAPPEQPAATPPPTIVNVQSKSRVCAALQESIGPSIAGLLQNDHTIVDGMFFLNKWGGDGGTLRAHMDMMHVETDVSGIVRNLSAVNQLLETREPADTPAPEAERIEGMKKALRNVAHEQLMTLNVLDGTLESSQMDEFMDNSSLPNFSSPSLTGGYHAPSIGRSFDAPSTGVTAKGDLDRPPLWSDLRAGDFFSLLKQSEDAAGVAVVAGSFGCTPVDHAVTLPK
jgi:hypothetical protein